MARNRFVVPTNTRIPISDGDWIEVKTELDTGDQKKLEAAGLLPPVLLDGKPYNPVDWSVYEIERAIIWLTDWSFKGPDDKPVKLTPDAVRGLDTETFDEINAAIFKHVAEQAAAKKKKKELLKSAENGHEPPSVDAVTSTS